MESGFSLFDNLLIVVFGEKSNQFVDDGFGDVHKTNVEFSLVSTVLITESGFNPDSVVRFRKYLRFQSARIDGRDKFRVQPPRIDVGYELVTLKSANNTNQFHSGKLELILVR